LYDFLAHKAFVFRIGFCEKTKKSQALSTTVVVNDNLSLLWDTTLRRELWRSDYRVGSVNCCGPMTA
jgi:hypothetical protein